MRLVVRSRLSRYPRAILAVSSYDGGPQLAFADAPKLDVVCVPGGEGRRKRQENEAFLTWLRDAGAAATSSPRRASLPASTWRCGPAPPYAFEV